MEDDDKQRPTDDVDERLHAGVIRIHILTRKEDNAVVGGMVSIEFEDGEKVIAASTHPAFATQETLQKIGDVIMAALESRGATGWRIGDAASDEANGTKKGTGN